jgi:hypothetical protein
LLGPSHARLTKCFPNRALTLIACAFLFAQHSATRISAGSLVAYWLGVKISLTLASGPPAEGSGPASKTRIRVLDIFGFETSETNTSE